jgi:transposase InsO family protein
LARICRLWDLPRSTVYFRRHRESIRPELRPDPQKRGPRGPCSDEELVGHIRRILTESRFHGEGYRKVWARLRYQGIRTSKERVRRLIREHGRHDHGSAYMSDDFQQELAFLGMTSSPSFVREPEGNGVAERFIRTLKENLLWVQHFATVAELIEALQEFKRLYDEQWLIERHGYRPPAQVRRDLTAPIPVVA